MPIWRWQDKEMDHFYRRSREDRGWVIKWTAGHRNLTDRLYNSTD